MSMSNTTTVVRWINMRTGCGSSVRSRYLPGRTFPSLLSYQQEIGRKVDIYSGRSHVMVACPAVRRTSACISLPKDNEPLTLVLEPGSCPSATTRRHADTAARMALREGCACVRVSEFKDPGAGGPDISVHREITSKLDQVKVEFRKARRARGNAAYHMSRAWGALYEAYVLALAFRVPVSSVSDTEVSVFEDSRAMVRVLNKISDRFSPVIMSEYETLANWQRINRPVRKTE